MALTQYTHRRDAHVYVMSTSQSRITNEPISSLAHQSSIATAPALTTTCTVDVFREATIQNDYPLNVLYALKLIQAIRVSILIKTYTALVLFNKKRSLSREVQGNFSVTGQPRTKATIHVRRAYAPDYKSSLPRSAPR